MSHEEPGAPQPVEPDQDQQQNDGEPQGGGVEETRGLDLGGLLGAALGQPGEKHTEGAAPASAADLGDLLAGLFGGGGEGEGLGLDGIAERSGVPKSALQAALPLVLGALLGGQQQTTTGSKPVGLGDLASLAAGGKPLDSESLEATGLPNELATKTGIDAKTAMTIIQAVLKALGVEKTAAKAKPKKKPKAKAKPKAKPKPKPSFSAKPKAKPKPKTAAGSTSAKPKAKSKPKTSASTSSAKPKPTSRPSGPKAKPKTTSTAKK